MTTMQTPRTFHNGIKGTFMTVETHNQYFRDIAYNQDASVSWSDRQAAGKDALPLYIAATQTVYENRITETMKKCIHIRNIKELSSPGII